MCARELESIQNADFEDFDLEPLSRLVPKGDYKEVDIDCVEQLIQIYHFELGLTIGARLSRFWKRWEMLGASSYTVRLLRSGLKLVWLQHRPPINIKPMVISHSKQPDKLQIMRSHMDQIC